MNAIVLFKDDKLLVILGLGSSTITTINSSTEVVVVDMKNRVYPVSIDMAAQLVHGQPRGEQPRKDSKRG